MKKSLVVLLAVLLIFVAAIPALAVDSKNSVALILEGPANDNSWNEAGYNALMMLKERGVEVACAESVEVGNAERIIRQYAELGYGLIIGHSFSFGDAILKVAPDYPDYGFAWAGGIHGTDTNVSDYEEPFYQAAYPIGIIAGSVSKSGKIGALYATDTPVCHSMGEALLAGAKTVNPDVELVRMAVGDWNDVVKAKEAALAQADLGVDYWIECGEGPALGAIAAANDVGGYATGYVSDMTENGPDVVLVNLIWDFEPIMTEMQRQVSEGSFSGEYFDYGSTKGAIKFQINEGLMDVIPAEAIEKANASMEAIASGEFVVEYIPQ